MQLIVEADEVKPVVSSIDRAMGEECVRGKWLSKIQSRDPYYYFFRAWLLWLWKIPEWNGKMPHELLDYQESTSGRKKYELIDLIQDWVQEKGGTYQSMLQRASILRTFWIKNRVDIPTMEGWQPHPTRESVIGSMSLEQVRDIIMHSNLRGTAIFLSMWQGMMDLERYCYFNQKYAEKLVTHLRNSKEHMFRVDFPSRKRNYQPYYTFLHSDALEAWRRYFEKERGYPKPGEALTLTRDRKPMSKAAIYLYFNNVARQLKIKPPPSTKKDYAYTGIAPHEAFRDVTLSLLQTAATKGFDMQCAEFWMGHSIDKYHYNKFFDKFPTYVLEKARIASNYLNILTNHQTAQAMTEEMKLIKVDVEALKEAIAFNKAQQQERRMQIRQEIREELKLEMGEKQK